jgi:hypothetical protein
METYLEIRGGRNLRVDFGEMTTTIGLDLPNCIVFLRLEDLNFTSNCRTAGIDTHITVLSHSGLLLTTTESIYRAFRATSGILWPFKMANHLEQQIDPVAVLVEVAHQPIMEHGGSTHAIMPFSIMLIPGLELILHIKITPPIGQVVVGQDIHRWQSKLPRPLHPQLTAKPVQLENTKTKTLSPASHAQAVQWGNSQHLCKPPCATTATRAKYNQQLAKHHAKVVMLGSPKRQTARPPVTRVMLGNTKARKVKLLAKHAGMGNTKLALCQWLVMIAKRDSLPIKLDKLDAKTVN